MSIKYLGAPFDIHTGGIDHREIHHPNEIAQNQAFCGCADSGAHFWMHNNFLVAREKEGRQGKMSKSKGGFTTLQSLIDAGVHPLAYRLMCLQAQYRSELEFSVENLAAALTRFKRLVMTVAALRARADGTGQVVAGWTERLDEAVSDDLNTPKALPILDELLAEKRLSPADRLATLAQFDAVLGLDLLELSRESLRIRPVGAALAETDIDMRLAERRDARAAKDFARSDAIRDELAASGVEVMDGDPLGWDWKPDL
jgi:cysteinyl-tRNA synthetase